MQPDNNTIHTFWISGPLRPINLLTIRSFQAHGHHLVLYAYDTAITNECEVRDARQIMPESEIFYYKNMIGGNPNFKFGGIAERLKAEMLYQLGGWHVDLDVTCLRNFGNIANTPYVFRPHPTHGIVANIIKAPARSQLALRYLNHTKTITAENTIWEASFAGLSPAAADLQLLHYTLPPQILGTDSDEYWLRLLKRNQHPHPLAHAIHWCSAMGKPIEPGSYLDYLYKKYKITTQ